MSEFRLPLNGDLGRALKRARKINRLTLQELSELSGVSYCEISRIENDLRVPNAYIVGRLEEALREANRICPKCSGNLFTEYDIVCGGLEKWCINCGYREGLNGNSIRHPATSRV